MGPLIVCNTCSTCEHMNMRSDVILIPRDEIIGGNNDIKVSNVPTGEDDPKLM